MALKHESDGSDKESPSISPGAASWAVGRNDIGLLTRMVRTTS